jgi:SAM-dependent methyltransferase
LTTTISVDVEKLDPTQTFDLFVDALSQSLEKSGMRFLQGPSGRINNEVGEEVGKVLSWQPGKQIQLEWPHSDMPTIITFTFDRREEGSRIALSWDRPMGSDTAIGWFAQELAVPFLNTSSEKNFGDWFTDRRARKPSGPEAKMVYGDPMYHKPNFLAILNALALTKDDYLLEVGCGGGLFLSWALKSGCRAAAIDHSPDMVALAKEKNAGAISEKRLEIQESEADHLPFPDSTFTCAISTGVFGFISDPVAVMKEVCRTLGQDGRFVMFTATKALRGTPAAPEPMASRIHFYEDEELVELASKAGFKSVRVENPDLSGYAKEAGLPEDVVSQLFSSSSFKYNQLLIANK